MIGGTNVGSIYYDLSLDKSKFDSGSKDVSSGLDNLSNKAHNVGKKIAVAFGVMSTAAIGFGVSSIKAFSESQDAIAQTEAVLKSTSGVAGITADKVTELATAWQKQTKYSDEAVRSAENVLLTFTNIGKDKFPQATEAVLDISTALGQDLQSSAIQVGKALQDPILGVTALRRVGVNFNEAQADVIKKMVETGNVADAQTAILKELQGEFGGSAKAAGNTFAGSLEKLKNSFNDVQESIGLTVVKAITPFVQRLSEFVTSDRFQAWVQRTSDIFSRDLSIALDWVANTGFPALKKVVEELWPVIQTLFGWFSDLVKFMTDHTWAFWAIVSVLGAIKLGLMLSGALEAFKAVMAGVIGSYNIMAAIVTSPLTMPAIGVAAALLAIGLVIAKFVELENDINSANKAIDNFKTQHAKNIADTKNLYYATGDAATKERTKKVLHDWGVAGFASGGSIIGNRAIMVGEQGPELFVPNTGGTIIPNDKMGSGITNTIGNIYINNKSDADYFLGRLMQSDQVFSKGLTPSGAMYGS